MYCVSRLSYPQNTSTMWLWRGKTRAVSEKTVRVRCSRLPVSHQQQDCRGAFGPSQCRSGLPPLVIGSEAKQSRLLRWFRTKILFALRVEVENCLIHFGDPPGRGYCDWSILTLPCKLRSVVSLRCGADVFVRPDVGVVHVKRSSPEVRPPIAFNDYSGVATG